MTAKPPHAYAASPRYGASDRRSPTAHEVGPASQAASTATMP